jgi:hypothetical protein
MSVPPDIMRELRRLDRSDWSIRQTRDHTFLCIRDYPMILVGNNSSRERSHLTKNDVRKVRRIVDQCIKGETYESQA